jgi:hypothetical protein
MDGKCISFMALSVISDVIERISDVGLNLSVAIDVVRLRTIFSGVGLVEVNKLARLEGSLCFMKIFLAETLLDNENQKHF